METKSLDITQLNEVHDKFEEEMQESPVVPEDVGSIESFESVPTLDKAAYYVVFANKEHTSDCVGNSIKSVHLARFESKVELKKVISSLDKHNFKLIDILKGRPLSFKVETKTISEITIGG